MSQSKFCIKSNLDKSDTLAALDDLLRVDSDLLIFGYGYIYQSKLITSFVEKLVKWLQKSPCRRVEFYVGVIPDPKKPLTESLAEQSREIQRIFQEVLPTRLYASGTTDRISVAAIIGFHCKFALACHDKGGGNIDPVAGIFGSSNLTWSALAGPNRFELDLWIGSDSPLLQDFTVAICEILNKACSTSELCEVGEGISQRIFRDPAIREAMDDTEADEVFDRIYHLDQNLDSAERAAQIESDREQGIHSEWPSRLG